MDIERDPFAAGIAALGVVADESAPRRQRRKPLMPRTDIITEDSAACAFADNYRNRLRYCHDTGAWFEWTGSVWRLIPGPADQNPCAHSRKPMDMMVQG